MSCNCWPVAICSYPTGLKGERCPHLPSAPTWLSWFPTLCFLSKLPRELGLPVCGSECLDVLETLASVSQDHGCGDRQERRWLQHQVGKPAVLTGAVMGPSPLARSWGLLQEASSTEQHRWSRVIPAHLTCISDNNEARDAG